MLNLKNISKLFLATFIFTILVTFPRMSFALDCSGDNLNAYQKQICEQQKALAEKNAKSNEKADNKADKAADKAKQKQQDAVDELAAQRAKAQGADGSINKKYEAQDKKEAAQTAQQKAAAEKAAAQKAMTAALKSGDMEAANAAKEKMAKADKAAEEAEKTAKAAAKEEKKASKEVDKQYKAATKAQEKADKAAAKAEKEKVKAAEKQEKTANKDADKAQKEIDKLEKKCAKDPDKCDTEALQAAYAKKEAADALAKDAQKNREDVDGTTAAKAAAEAERLAAEEAERQKLLQSMYPEEDGPNEAEIQAYDCVDSSTGQSCKLSKDNKETCICKYKEVYTDANGLTKEGEIGTFDKLDKNGNPVAMQRCYEAKGVFDTIACKAMTTLADLRVIVYTLAGFGLIAFAFAAIFNKISWKHLAHLCFALFLLSMMTPFIEYFTQKDGTALKYGNYLPAGFSSVKGSGDAPVPCDTKKGDVCPDVTVDTSAKDSKWSWKDLKNTVKSGITAAQQGYNTYKTVKSTVETVATQAKKIGTAIKNHEGGLTGILDTMGEIATASNTIMNSTTLAANAVVANTSSIATNIQNAGKSGAELKFDQENKNRINELEKKMAAGNLSPEQMEYAKAELEQRKAAESKNAVADFANNQGKGALGSIGKVVETGSKITKATTVAANAAQVGSNIGGGIGSTGGDIVGGIFGAATLLGEGIDINTQNKEAKAQAAAAEKAKAEKAAADAKRKAETKANNASYSQGKQWDGSYNAVSSGSSSANAATGGDKAVGAPKPSTSTPSSSSSSSSSSGSKTKPNTDLLPKDSVTITKTETFPGNKNQGTDGYNINLGDSSYTTSVTYEDAVQNPNGTITQKDCEGRSCTFDSKGNIINTKDAKGNLTSGREDTYWDGVDNTHNWGAGTSGSGKGSSSSGSSSQKTASSASSQSPSECYNSCLAGVIESKKNNSLYDRSPSMSERNQCKSKCNY